MYGRLRIFDERTQSYKLIGPFAARQADRNGGVVALTTLISSFVGAQRFEKSGRVITGPIYAGASMDVCSSPEAPQGLWVKGKLLLDRRGQGSLYAPQGGAGEGAQRRLPTAFGIQSQGRHPGHHARGAQRDQPGDLRSQCTRRRCSGEARVAAVAAQAPIAVAVKR
jgi:hypothetical protein